MPRPIFAFTAATRTGAKRYVNADRQLVDDPATAVEFTLNRSPLARERHRIDVRLHSLAGGLDEWLDLQQGIDLARTRLRSQVVDLAFPDGLPEATSPEELAAVDKALDEAWDRADLRLRSGLLQMTALARRLDFLARWAVLFVSATVNGSPVDGWQDVAELELSEAALDALWLSHDDALTQEAAASGKAQPSAS